MSKNSNILRSTTVVGESKTNGRANGNQQTRSYLGGRDFELSKRLAYCGPIDLPHHFVVLRWLCRLLEHSGHGLPWFVVTIAQTSVAIRWDAVEFWTNMVWALIVDIIVVGSVKAIVRRSRPDYATQVKHTFSADRFSFPSGHSSRAVMMAVLFCARWTVDYNLQLAFMGWAAAVCVSRAILGRHYVSDVVAGAVLGAFLAWFQLSFLWLDLKTCFWILWPLHEYLFI
ncbi:hypothetical protein BV898_10553 [Hypsibius exemplaris]|uniref:Phosphatidic acid phosphatase type 2/haloperoxidase domain-containing protein n=1 Tax=Hypsibius exemplaris TaxID=2072580 RepID=A0A1W0WJI6_HYPEX|nr:hypothetical protein BV898_10553 [Hypsibius exemplaris]